MTETGKEIKRKKEKRAEAEKKERERNKRRETGEIEKTKIEREERKEKESFCWLPEARRQKLCLLAGTLSLAFKTSRICRYKF